MRKAIVLLAVVATLGVTVGCQNCSWFRRGALFRPRAEVVDPCVDPCAPVVGTVVEPGCDTCGTTTVPPANTTYLTPGPTG
ncbi:hypothetical protein JCM19992_31610 [Thermostilla marina]